MIVFEILGPILLCFSVLKSGEVPIAYAIRHSRHSFKSRLTEMWMHLKTSSGVDPLPTTPAEEVTVGQLLRSKVKGIPHGAEFDKIIHHIEQSHDNTFPVIDARRCVVGLIRYPMLSQLLFDPNVGELVRAIDIATAVEKVVYPDELASVAFDFFQHSSDDCLPVVSREEPHIMLGIVRRSDVRTILIQKKRNRGRNASQKSKKSRQHKAGDDASV